MPRKSEVGSQGSVRGEKRRKKANAAQHSFEKFVELVVRTDPGPLDSVPAPFADHANIPAYSDRPIIGVTAELFELKRIVRRIL